MRFLGYGVSAELQFTPAQLDVLKRRGLPILACFEDVAQSLEIPVSTLKWLVYRRQMGVFSHYHSFDIPKRNGGVRKILAPKPSLRRAQTWLLKTILERIPVRPHATAYRKGTSILTNATPHVGQKFLFKLDLKDFFPSITFRRVRGVFKSLGYSSGVSTVLSLIATASDFKIERFDGKRVYIASGPIYLPQGAPTSPAISNLICRSLDKKLAAYASSEGLEYTRYSDDMTFSSSEWISQKRKGRILAKIEALIAAENFEVRSEKTRLVSRNLQQTVTGIVVNQKLNISKAQYQWLRCFLHYVDMSNLSCALGNVARGKVAHLKMVNPQRAQRLEEKYTWLKTKTISESFEIPDWYKVLVFHRLDGLLLVAHSQSGRTSAFRFRDRDHVVYETSMLTAVSRQVTDWEILSRVARICGRDVANLDPKKSRGHELDAVPEESLREELVRIAAHRTYEQAATHARRLAREGNRMTGVRRTGNFWEVRVSPIVRDWLCEGFVADEELIADEDSLEDSE